MREIANKQGSDAQSIRDFYIAELAWTKSERLTAVVQATSRREAIGALKISQRIDIRDGSVGDYEGEAKDKQRRKVVEHEV